MRRIRVRRRPGFEPLEGRALFSAGLDASFGQSGQIIGSFGPLAIGRLNADGSPDTSFNGSGAYKDPKTGFNTTNALALQPDGKLVAVGRSDSGTFFAERLNPDGTLDTGFGTVGLALVPSPLPSPSGEFRLDRECQLGRHPGQRQDHPRRLGADQLIPFGIPGAGNTLPAPADRLQLDRWALGPDPRRRRDHPRRRLPRRLGPAKHRGLLA